MRFTLPASQGHPYMSVVRVGCADSLMRIFCEHRPPIVQRGKLPTIFDRTLGAYLKAKGVRTLAIISNTDNPAAVQTAQTLVEFCTQKSGSCGPTAIPACSSELSTRRSPLESVATTGFEGAAGNITFKDGIEEAPGVLVMWENGQETLLTTP